MRLSVITYLTKTKSTTNELPVNTLETGALLPTESDLNFQNIFRHQKEIVFALHIDKLVVTPAAFGKMIKRNPMIPVDAISPIG